MSTGLERLKTANEKIAELHKQIRAEAQANLADALKQFMTEHPQVQTIMWCQYTPYFNDGEECTFSVGDVIFSTELCEQFTYDSEGEIGADRVSPETYRDCTTLRRLLRSMEDELKLVFGDHVGVVVTPDGISVEEYEHE